MPPSRLVTGFFLIHEKVQIRRILRAVNGRFLGESFQAWVVGSFVPQFLQ